MKVELYTEEGCDDSGCCNDCMAVEEVIGKAIASLQSDIAWQFVHQQCKDRVCCPELPCLSVDGKILLSGSGWREKEIKKAVIDSWKGESKKGVQGKK